jgi:hypothetical protein
LSNRLSQHATLLPSLPLEVWLHVLSYLRQ